MSLGVWLLFVLGLVRSADAQPIISTFAGSPYQFDGDGKRAIQAPLGRIAGVAVDTLGQVYVADPDNHMVMRFTPNGTLNVIAGNGIAGYSGDGGPATRASLNSPASLAFDLSGNLYIADYGNQTIRKLAPDGTITTVSSGSQYGYDLRYWGAFALDPAGNLYIGNGSVILKISTDGTTTTIAGTGQTGYSGDNGPATSAAINGPAAIAIDRSGNIYFSDSNNFHVRKISNGVISTVVGTGVAAGSLPFGIPSGADNGPATLVALAGPEGLAFDSAGNLYIADTDGGHNNRVRRLSTTGNLTTVAGSPNINGAGDQGFSGDGGSATAATLNTPSAVAVDSAGNLYIADTGNGRVRRVNSFGAISTAAGNGGFGDSGDGGPAVNASFMQPADVAVDSAGNVYVADPEGQRVRKIDTSGVITTVAGSGEQGFTGDGGPAVNATFHSPSRVAVDRLGNVFIVDGGNFRIRKVAPGGTITTIAGGGSSPADGVLATTAGLSDVYAITVDSAGSVYIADGGVIRKITSDGKIARFAGGGQAFADGVQATNASFTANSLAFDAAGNLYLGDVANYNRVRKISPSGVISTVAGNSAASRCSGEGGPAIAAGLGQIFGIAADSAGNLYLSDHGCNKVWQVSPSGVITTLAGDGRNTFAGDGGPAATASISAPGGVALDPQGNVYIADTGNQRLRRVQTASARSRSIARRAHFLGEPPAGALPPVPNLALTTAFSRPDFSNQFVHLRRKRLARHRRPRRDSTNGFAGVRRSDRPRSGRLPGDHHHHRPGRQSASAHRARGVQCGPDARSQRFGRSRQPFALFVARSQPDHSPDQRLQSRRRSASFHCLGDNQFRRRVAVDFSSFGNRHSYLTGSGRGHRRSRKPGTGHLYRSGGCQPRHRRQSHDSGDRHCHCWTSDHPGLANRPHVHRRRRWWCGSIADFRRAQHWPGPDELDRARHHPLRRRKLAAGHAYLRLHRCGVVDRAIGGSRREPGRPRPRELLRASANQCGWGRQHAAGGHGGAERFAAR